LREENRVTTTSSSSPFFAVTVQVFRLIVTTARTNQNQLESQVFEKSSFEGSNFGLFLVISSILLQNSDFSDSAEGPH
jgi:hypothetical protein